MSYIRIIISRISRYRYYSGIILHLDFRVSYTEMSIVNVLVFASLYVHVVVDINIYFYLHTHLYNAINGKFIKLVHLEKTGQKLYIHHLDQGSPTHEVPRAASTTSRGPRAAPVKNSGNRTYKNLLMRETDLVTVRPRAAGWGALS